MELFILFFNNTVPPGICDLVITGILCKFNQFQLKIAILPNSNNISVQNCQLGRGRAHFLITGII